MNMTKISSSESKNEVKTQKSEGVTLLETQTQVINYFWNSNQSLFVWVENTVHPKFALNELNWSEPKFLEEIVM